MDPFKCAKEGDLEFFKTVDVDVLRSSISPDRYGNSLLIEAVRFRHLECCEIILERCPSLLYFRNNYGATVLHQAADLPENDTRDRIVKLLLNAEDGQSREIMAEQSSGYKLLALVDMNGDSAMHVAVKKRQIGVVKLLIEADHNFEYSANSAGHTPLWIAFQEALTGDLTAVEIRRLLIEKQPHQCKVPTGPNNWTVLHYAAFQGDLSTIEDITRFCPDCLDLVDNKGQNFLHLAAKFQHADIVNHTLGIPNLPAGVLNGQDYFGNTPLHIAALGAEQQDDPESARSKCSRDDGFSL